MAQPYEDDRGVQWMLAYQRGSEAAFDRIVEAYSGQVYGLFTRFLGPVPEREDLVQEVFLRVIRARERWKPTARLSTWLYRIAFNLAVNRSQRRSPELSIDAEVAGEGAQHELDDPSAPQPSEALERGDVVDAVQAALAALPEKQRMALVLARFEDQSLAEIAEVLDSTEKAVKSLVHRARENLRARLAPFLPQLYP